MAIPTVAMTTVNLLVLATLMEGPMHPYEIQRLAIEREKTSIQGVKRGSIYHAVQRLEAAGLIEALESERQGRRPERTVYQLTDLGRDETRQWLATLLRKPGNAVPELITAMEFLAILEPDEVLAALENRTFQLDREIGGLRASMASIGDRLPRIFVIEVELSLALKEAERAWVARIVAEIRAGAFTWNRAELHEWAAHSPPFGSGVHRRAAAAPGAAPGAEEAP